MAVSIAIAVLDPNRPGPPIAQSTNNSPQRAGGRGARRPECLAGESGAGADGVPARSTDWGKILMDLHAGKIGGEIGKAIMSAVALLLLLLTVSGVYVWLKPSLIRRRNRQEETRVAASAAAYVPRRSVRLPPEPRLNESASSARSAVSGPVRVV